MKFHYICSKRLGAFYLFMVSFVASTGALLATPQRHLVGIQGNTMKITNGTSTPITLIIERTSAPNQHKEDEYEVMNNLQPQATYKLDYEYVAGGDKKQQQVTSILVFPGGAKALNIPLGKVPKRRVPAGGTKINIPLKANYILKTGEAPSHTTSPSNALPEERTPESDAKTEKAEHTHKKGETLPFHDTVKHRGKTPDNTTDQTKVATYELYAQESQQASPSHHRYFKVETAPDNSCFISPEVGLVIQAVPSF